jgi:hypothetical protein
MNPPLSRSEVLRRFERAPVAYPARQRRWAGVLTGSQLHAERVRDRSPHLDITQRQRVALRIVRAVHDEAPREPICAVAHILGWGRGAE